MRSNEALASVVLDLAGTGVGQTPDLPEWVSAAASRLRSDEGLLKLVADVKSKTRLDDVLKRLDLFENRHTEMLFSKVYEIAISVRALGNEISALRGQMSTLEADFLASVTARNAVIRSTVGLRDEMRENEALCNSLDERLTNQFSKLSTWAKEADVGSDGMYGNAAVNAAVRNAQHAAAANGKAGDDSEQHRYSDPVGPIVARQEEKGRRELEASGTQWSAQVSDLTYQAKRARSQSKLIQLLLDGRSSPRAAGSAPPDASATPPDADSTNAEDMLFDGVLADAELKGREVASRALSMGEEGFNLQARVTTALFRFTTERLVLRIFMAALVSSVAVVDVYRQAFPVALIETLERLCSWDQDIGSNADAVFECLARLDMVLKRIALNSARHETAGAILISGVTLPRVVVATRHSVADRPTALCRYVRAVAIDGMGLFDVLVASESGPSVELGAVLPLSAGRGEPAGSDAFWNLDPWQEWRLSGRQVDETAPTKKLLFAVGYELMTLTPNVDIG